MHKRFVEQEGRWLRVATDDSRQRQPLEQVDQRAGAKAEIVDILIRALVLGPYLKGEVVPDADITIAPVRDRGQLPLDLPLDPCDHAPPYPLPPPFPPPHAPLRP